MENRSQSSDAKGIVPWNREVVLPGLVEGEPHVTAGLSHKAIAETLEFSRESVTRDIAR